MTDLSPSGIATLWTTVPFSKSDDAGASHYFVANEFSASNSNSLFYNLKKLQTDLSKKDSELPLIAIIRLQGETPWFVPKLCANFPTFPSSSIHDIANPGGQPRGIVSLPKLDKQNQALSFSMQYPYILSDGGQGHGSQSSKGIMMFAPVVVWISASTAPATILLICRDEHITDKLQSHLVSGNWQCSLLKRNPARIFMDLLIFLSEWAEVWAVARQDLARRNYQVTLDELPLLQKTTELHRDAASIISLREDLRLHITALQRFSSLVSSQRPLMAKLGLLSGKQRGSGQHVSEDNLEEQVEECLQNLLHQQESGAVIQKQLENLLSLAFNTEMVSQGQAVARLNFLAFIFLPLSFVATLFGMTTFTISAVWYPLGAFAVVLIVLLGFITANHLPNNILRPFKNKKKTEKSKKDKKDDGRFSKIKVPKLKASYFSWMKPNYHWLCLVPVIGCCLWVVVARKKKRAPPDAEMAAPLPAAPSQYYPPVYPQAQYTENLKVSSPMSQSQLYGAGIPSYMDPVSRAPLSGAPSYVVPAYYPQQQQPQQPQTPQPEADPQVESSSGQRPSVRRGRDEIH